MKQHSRWITVTFSILIALALQFLLVPSQTLAMTIEYALLTEGASISSVSSQYPAGDSQIAKDNLLRPVKLPWLSNGETGFIFANGDNNQSITLDLGSIRNINRVGANFIPPYGDRYVWDYLGISISNDNTGFTLVGHIGTNGDGIYDVTSSPKYFDLADTGVRYVKYDFGTHSPMWSDGGSRVVDLYAQNVTVPEPITMLLLGLGLVGLAGVRRKS